MCTIIDTDYCIYIIVYRRHLLAVVLYISLSLLYCTTGACNHKKGRMHRAQCIGTEDIRACNKPSRRVPIHAAYKTLLTIGANSLFTYNVPEVPACAKSCQKRDRKSFSIWFGISAKTSLNECTATSSNATEAEATTQTANTASNVIL